MRIKVKREDFKMAQRLWDKVEPPEYIIFDAEPVREEKVVREDFCCATCKFPRQLPNTCPCSCHEATSNPAPARIEELFQDADPVAFAEETARKVNETVHAINKLNGFNE